MTIYVHKLTGWHVVMDDQHFTEGFITFHTYPTGLFCRLLTHEFRQQFRTEQAPIGEMKVVSS